MTPELRAAVDAAYRVFDHYRLGTSLTICDCEVCMCADDEKALLETPLREIPAKLLAEYTNSAHGWDDADIAHEMRYFLPRYFELIADDDPPDHMGLARCLRRIGEGQWRETWPRAEVDAIDAFFDALMIASVARIEIVPWPNDYDPEFDVLDILTLVITASGDLDRLLATWDAAADPGAAVHLARARDSVKLVKGQVRYESVYLDDRPADVDRITGFLTRPSVTERIRHVAQTTDNATARRTLACDVHHSWL